jgi:hypothetical protein
MCYHVKIFLDGSGAMTYEAPMPRRPRTAPQKLLVLQTRVTEPQLAQVRAAATQEGLTVSEFVRLVVLRAASLRLERF